MMNTLGIVEARLEPELATGKVARRLGGKPLLEWVVRRATDCQRLDRVIVLATGGPGTPRISKLVPADVPVFSASDADLLACYQSALQQYPARSVVRIAADNPFVDPELIDRLVSTADEHAHCDYIGYCRRDGVPAIRSSLGMFSEWFRVEALRRAATAGLTKADRQQPTRFLYSHPELFAIRLIPAPEGLDRDDVRLAVESEEDWDHAQIIFEALGAEALDWQRIAGLLEQQPDLRSRMAALNQRESLARLRP